MNGPPPSSGEGVALRAIPVSLMRGGTSKGVFLPLGLLQSAEDARDRFVLDLMGSPDPMQIDGLGGTHSSTSKVVGVRAGRDERAAADIEYLFGQVGVEQGVVDWRGNCGNLSAAVAPYAIHEGLVAAAAPVSEVRMLNLNTGKLVTAHVPVVDGEPAVLGDLRIAGVPGTGAAVRLEWHDPGGSVTGRTLPTGSAREPMGTSFGQLEVSVVDVGSLYAFVEAEALGLTGSEDAEHLNRSDDLLDRVREVRALCAERAGIAPFAEADLVSPAVPRVCIVGAARSYTTALGDSVQDSEYDVAARMTSMGRFHHALPGTGILCLAAACAIEGTVPHRRCKTREPTVRIGHNKGVVSAAATIAQVGQSTEVVSVSSYRTARRLMAGTAFVRTSVDEPLL